uniref:Putative secreted peptide n=1 Tax=Anopheles braziliensis TaxID=58242 RepID=A0A2M3ZXB0_9DIPT
MFMLRGLASASMVSISVSWCWWRPQNATFSYLPNIYTRVGSGMEKAIRVKAINGAYLLAGPTNHTHHHHAFLPTRPASKTL